jgi:rhomboid protease GluP
MAAMYLGAGAFGNLLGVAHGWLGRTSPLTVGASGAIAGVLAAALVLGWRDQGWRGAVTQATARWLAFLTLLGLLSAHLGRGGVDNAAHLGGAFAGAAIALTWRRGHRVSPRATAVVVSACAAVVVGCIALVSVRDRLNAFAAMDLQARDEFTVDALRAGRCREAHEGLAAVERLREGLGPVSSLRQLVEATCGHLGGLRPLD